MEGIYENLEKKMKKNWMKFKEKKYFVYVWPNIFLITLNIMYLGECIPFLKNSDLEWNMKTIMEINLEKNQ